MRISVIFCFLILYSLLGTVGQAQQIQSIEITSRWGGLGTPRMSSVSVVRRGLDYYSNGKKIDESKLRALATALDEPTLNSVSLVNLGVTQESLNKNGRICVKDCVNGYVARANPSQKQLFLDNYTDTNVVEKELHRILRGGWTDDYPSFKAEIQFVGGREIELSSDNQVLFMVPWTVRENSSERKTFNAHISAALVSIIPSKFTNRERLNGDGLYEGIASSLLRTIEADWKRLEVLEKVKTTVDAIEKDFTIVSMELNSFHDSDYGTPWDSDPIEKNLHMVLRRKDFPNGFAIKLILPVEGNEVRNIDLFRQSIGRYLHTIDSVPWLKQFIHNSGKSVWLRFVKNRSFSEKGMASFAKDMKALGKDKLAAEVETLQDKVAVLSIGGGHEYYQSFWLIFPDGRSVVWRHYYLSPLLDVKFVGKKCADARSNTQPCVGAVISREGLVLEM